MLRNNHLSSPNEQPKPYLEIEIAITKEILRQVNQSFSIRSIIVIASLIIGVFGAGLVLTGKATEGAVAAAAGLISSSLGIQQEKESQEKLEMLIERLERLHEKEEL